jgi:hypothetical protein
MPKELYTTYFTEQIERFLEEVSNDTCALSGMDFFYITRKLVLTVAGKFDQLKHIQIK